MVENNFNYAYLQAEDLIPLIGLSNYEDRSKIAKVHKASQRKIFLRNAILLTYNGVLTGTSISLITEGIEKLFY